MFESTAALIESGEEFARALTPAKLKYAGTVFPCKIGALKFHEVLGQNGFRAVKSMNVTLRRMDVNPAIQFQRGQPAQVERQLRGGQTEEVVGLEIGDLNAGDGTLLYLNLERPGA